MFRRRLLLGSVLSSLILGFLPLSTAEARAGVVDDLLGRQFLNELNAERSARGLPGLQWDASIAAASSGWAEELRGGGALRHSSHGRAEIVGAGSRTGQITEAWMLSSGHRNLVADPNLAAVGIGVRCDARGRIWVVAQFGQADPYQRSPSSTAAVPRVTPGSSGLSCSSHDAVERAIRRLYVSYFGRDADAGGLAHWMQHAGSGHPLDWISEQFAVSAEFQARYGPLSDEQFVHLVYRNVLRREADAGGHGHWMGVLKGRGRGSVMIGFSESQELRIRTGLS